MISHATVSGHSGAAPSLTLGWNHVRRLPKELDNKPGFLLGWVAIVSETSELVNPKEMFLKHTWQVHRSLLC